MNGRLGTSALALALLGALLASPLAAKDRKAPMLLEFNTMTGVTAGLVAPASLRDIVGGGLPWSIAGASGELRSDGKLELVISGLVFAAGPNAGANTLDAMRAVVSCVQADGSVANVATAPFPVTVGPLNQGGGDAAVEARLALPGPCLAPVVFVTNAAANRWFAVTGN